MSLRDFAKFYLADNPTIPKVGAEIGVCGGGTGGELLEDGLELLYSIDSWRKLNQIGDGQNDDTWHLWNYMNAVKSLSKFESRSIIIRGKSEDVFHLIPNSHLGILLIDGDHSYEGVKKDLNNYYGKLVESGVIALHDYHTGVKQAVDEFCKQKSLVVKVLDDLWAFFIKHHLGGN